MNFLYCLLRLMVTWGSAMVHIRLETTPNNVSDGPWAHMKDRGMNGAGNVWSCDAPYSSEIQSIMLTFTATNPNAKVDYTLYLDGVEKKKGTAIVYQGSVGVEEIRFFFFTSQS